MEPKIIKDPETPKGAIAAEFSFRQHFNIIKGIGQPAKNVVKHKMEEGKMKKFKQWLDENKASTEKLTYPAYFSDYSGIVYQGVLASVDIGTNETILKIPASLMITTNAALNSEIKAIFLENPELFNKDCIPSYWQNNIMATYLLFEKQKAEKSFWYPYISTLPTKFDWLIDWNENELMELQDSILIQDAKVEVKELSLVWEKLRECLLKYKSYFKEEYLVIEEIKWAYGIVYTRAFCIDKINSISIGGWKRNNALIPLADLLNHENVDVTYKYCPPAEEDDSDDESDDTSGCDTDNDSDYIDSEAKFWKPANSAGESMASAVETIPGQFIVKTCSQSFKKGSQVYVTYGRHANRDLLLYYGFTLEKNKYNYAYFRMALKKTPNRLENAYKESLVRRLFSSESSLARRLAIITYLKVVAGKLAEPHEALMESRSITKEIAALGAIIELYQTFLPGMKTSLEEDAKLLMDTKERFTYRKYMAVKYRMETKMAFQQQIKAGQIALEILKRIQSLVPFEAACSRVYELEAKSEVIINRIVLSKYLNQLKKGLDKNKKLLLSS